MRLSDALRPRTAEEVRRDILTQIKAESERSGVAMNSEWASDKAAAEGGEQGRAITREEEARVRALLRDALDVYPSGINLYWSHDDKRMTSVSIDADGQSYRDLTRDEVAKAARAGIVPGAEGWCWAPSASVATPGDECIGCSHSRGSHDRSDGSCIYCNCPEFKGAAVAPPAWLTAAVLAALPCDGTILDHQAIVRALCTPRPGDLRHAFSGDDVTTALDFLVASGEIETDNIHGVRWRRWGVPEGWGWLLRAGYYALAPLVPGDGPCVAKVADDAPTWSVWRGDVRLTGGREGDADSAKRAALRACWTLRAFAAVGPTLTTSTPQGAGMGAAPSRQAYDPTRIRERLTTLLAKGPRKALDLLLDVLAIGAPKGFALPDLRANLTAIGARMVNNNGEKWGLASGGGEAAAVAAPAPTRAEQVRLALLAVLTRGAVATRGMLLPVVEGEMGAPAGSVEPSEARQAAREIGAEVDGPRWSLPAMPPGFQWLKSYTQGEVYYLAPIAYADMRKDQIARVEEEHGLWDWKLSHGGEWHTCDSLADGQAQALAAARRAGLFARSPAIEVTGDGGPPVLPAVTSQGGEAVVPVAPSTPLDALALAICVYPNARVPEVRDALAAWGAELVEQARAPLADSIEAMRFGGDGALTTGVPHATVEASIAQRAYAADAPLLYACWKASTTARDAYRAEGMSSRFSRSLVALWDLLDASERPPTDPGNDSAERVADLQRAHDNAVASARKTGAQANALEADLRAMRERAERAERDRDAYLSKALAAEAREGEEHNRRCEAERELAALQAGLDGLRTWAEGTKGAAR